MDKSTKSYELVMIMSASLEDEVIDNLQKKYDEYFKNNNIVIFDVEKLGRKRMAYQIKKIRTGYYLIIRFNSLGEFVQKLERTLELDEQVLRYLTVRMDKAAMKYWELSKAKAITLSSETEDFGDELISVANVINVVNVVKETRTN